ncbi:unnamed protein product [Cuscuta campestris]|uniref:Uncharacterized protein n=1 Tax=Cuscuta campestris TaxID=132261 RepID=A0A484LX13_9ASTE|nr:unnamed protein product [Cuscuta campestris]
MGVAGDFWSSRELWAAVDEVAKAAEVRKKYEEFINDVPSFNIRMTQILQEEGGGVSKMESMREMQKRNEVNEEVKQVNITPAGPDNTPSMVVTTLEFGSIKVTVEERRIEEDVGLKRKIDDMFMIEGEMEEGADAFKVVCDELEYGWSLTNPCDVDMGNRVDILYSSSAGVKKIDKYDKMPNVVVSQALKRWDCGLKKGDEKAVNALQTKYCVAIVELDVNEVKDRIRHLNFQFRIVLRFGFREQPLNESMLAYTITDLKEIGDHRCGIFENRGCITRTNLQGGGIQNYGIHPGKELRVSVTKLDFIGIDMKVQFLRSQGCSCFQLKVKNLKLQLQTQSRLLNQRKVRLNTSQYRDLLLYG